MGCEFTGARGVFVTNPDGLDVKFDGNIFNLSGGDGTRNICLEGNSDDEKVDFGDVEIYRNTLNIIEGSSNGNALVTLRTTVNNAYTINLAAGKKVYCYGNILNDGKLFCGDDGASEVLSTDTTKVVNETEKTTE